MYNKKNLSFYGANGKFVKIILIYVELLLCKKIHINKIFLFLFYHKGFLFTSIFESSIILYVLVSCKSSSLEVKDFDFRYIHYIKVNTKKHLTCIYYSTSLLWFSVIRH